MKKTDAILFDLDGTLLDTAPDLYASMCDVLNHYQEKIIPYETFRPSVYQGTKSMIATSFGEHLDRETFDEISTLFLETYHQNNTNETIFFPGIEDLLTSLKKKNCPWGIVTNKPTWLTENILTHFSILNEAECVVMGDTLPTKKPNPEPILHACSLMKVDPTLCYYVGDTESDAIAAHTAGLKPIAVLYGYHNPNTELHRWPTHHVIQDSESLQSYFLETLFCE